MTKRNLLYAVLAVFIFGLPVYLYSAEEAKPKIEIVTKDLDTGEVKKGKMLDFNIQVKSAGQQDMVITNVYSSCGCFEVTDKRWPSSRLPASGGSLEQYSSSKVEKKPEPVIVKPGKSIFIATRLDTNKVTGQFEKQLYVESNDPENKKAVWKIKGTVLDTLHPALSHKEGEVIPLTLPSPLSLNKGEGKGEGKLVMLFYLPGCDECKEIKNKFLASLKEKYQDKIIIVEYNIDNPESFAFMIDLQNKYEPRAKKGFFNPKPPSVFIENKFLYGVKEIEENLEKYLTFTSAIVK